MALYREPLICGDCGNPLQEAVHWNPESSVAGDTFDHWRDIPHPNCRTILELMKDDIMNELSKEYRHESNPTEKKLHDAFIAYCKNPAEFARIAFPTLDGNTPRDGVSDREIQIMINTIQWVGSPVGESWYNQVIRNL